MSNKDWYRRSSWTPADQKDFDQRLARARTHNQSQYLRIQAHCLAQAEHYLPAIILLDRLIREFPDSFDIAMGFLQLAECHARLGRLEESLGAFDKCLVNQRANGQFNTPVWLIYPLFVAEHQITARYPDAQKVLEEFKANGIVMFPVQEYRYHAAWAVLCKASGNVTNAKMHAIAALNAASESHSGFRYHPKAGLVQALPPSLQSRLEKLRDD